jgi:hypothetical protein
MRNTARRRVVTASLAVLALIASSLPTLAAETDAPEEAIEAGGGAFS